MPQLPSDFEMLQLEIQAHLQPEIMTTKPDVEGLDKKLLERYGTLIHVLNQAFKKVQRYELIFTEFYPNTPNITVHEALEHHIHAYLADISILRNAINRLLGSLKNDVLKIASNKDEMSEFFKQCLKVTHKRFNEATEHRDAHAHAETRFLDPDLTRSSGLQMLTKEGTPMRDMIKPEAIEGLVKDAEESLQRSKERWQDMAKRNAEGLAKMMDALFISMEHPIYKCLKIKPILREKLKQAKPADSPPAHEPMPAPEVKE